MDITQEIRKRFRYNPSNGELLLANGRWPKSPAIPDGNWSHPRILVNGLPMTPQRVAWIHWNGYTRDDVLPKNQDWSDLRLGNLRLAHEPWFNDTISDVAMWVIAHASPGTLSAISDLHRAYGESKLSLISFGKVLSRLGVKKKRTANRIFIIGVVP